MTAKAVRCTHPVYGCVRPYKTYATRLIVICKPKSGGAESLLNRLARCIDRGRDVSRDALEHVGRYAQDLQAVHTTLRPSDAVTAEERQAQFLSLQEAWQSSTDAVHQHFAKMMSSFEPGLFVGGEAADFPTDNLDLERWFKGAQRS